MYPTDSRNDEDKEGDGEIEVEEASGVNPYNSGEPSGMSTSFSPEQVALFTLRHEFQNRYDLFIDTDYVSWLPENNPEDVPW